MLYKQITLNRRRLLAISQLFFSRGLVRAGWKERTLHCTSVPKPEVTSTSYLLFPDEGRSRDDVKKKSWSKLLQEASRPEDPSVSSHPTRPTNHCFSPFWSFLRNLPYLTALTIDHSKQMAHHEPYKALGAIAWDDVESADLGSLFDASFSAARILVNSVPAAAAGSPPSAASAGRRRSATDSAALTPHMVVVAADAARDAAEADAAATLRREWKEVRAGAAPRDNPHAIAVYKMGGRDGGGTWFARRSVHAGLAFDRWRRGLEAELPETLLRRPAGGEPGTGNIRGIGAERTVEQRVLAGKGQLKGGLAWAADRSVGC